MDSDFRPPHSGTGKSLQEALDALQDTKNQPLKSAPATKPEPDFTIEEDPTDLDIRPDQFESQADETQPKPPKAKHSWRQKLHFEWPPTKKQVIIGSVTLLVVASGLAVAISHFGPRPLASAKSIVASKPPAKKVTTVPSTLTGLPVDPSVNQRPVTAVMIENSPDARPQAGLSQAGVVFEALAEGGVTRFMALYQDSAPANLGPVRSARPYYLQWALGFDAAYAHVGGSPDALADIKAWGVKDLDEFYNGGSYHRVASRVAPHNMYTSMAALNQLEASKGYNTSTYTGFVRKTAAPAKTPTVKSIDLTMSGPIYNVHYDYNLATNTYNRSVGGAPHIDANTNQQISPNVVIAMVVPYSLGALDATGAYYSDYNPIGSGQVYVFQDGTVTTGQWNKPDAKSQITFTGSNGQPIGLNPGQTWITAVKSASDVSSSP